LKLNEEVAQALTNLRASEDFGRVLKWVAEYTDKETETCILQDGLLLYRAQGAVEALRSFMRSYAEAPQLVEKLKTQNRGNTR